MDDFLPPCYPPCFVSPFSVDGHHNLTYGAMDDLLPPCYPPRIMSPFSADDHHQSPAPDFPSCDALEKWLLGNADVLDNHDDEDPQDTGSSLPPQPAVAPLTERKRGRKPASGSRAAGTTITHVEAERLRRDRLNRLFCGLRTAVPAVTGMDRASLLTDAVGYITKLRGRVEQLEAEAEAKRTTAASLSQLPLLIGGSRQELEVRMHGRDAAALRLMTTAARHAPARLMAALCALDLPVQHASMCRVGGVTVQDVVVDVPAAGLRGEDSLRTALLHKLLQ